MKADEAFILARNYAKKEKDNYIINKFYAKKEEYSTIINFSKIGNERLARIRIYGNVIEKSDGTKSYTENPIVNIRGKNLAESVYYLKNGQYQPVIKINPLGIVPNKQYMVSFAVEDGVSSNAFTFYLDENFSSAGSRYLGIVEGRNKIKSTFNQSLLISQELLKNNSNSVFKFNIKDLQIEDGTLETEFEERKGFSFIFKGVTLRKDGDNADCIFFNEENNLWCIKRCVDESGVSLSEPNLEVLSDELQKLLNKVIVSDGMCVEVHCKNGVVPSLEADVISKNYSETLKIKNSENVDKVDFVHCENGRFYTESGEEFFVKGMNDGNHYDNNINQSLRELHEDWFINWNSKVNTIRFLMSYKWFEFDEEPFVYREEGFEYLHRIISECKKRGIRLILDMHRNQGGFQGWDNNGFRTDEKIERLVKLFEEFAKRYADEPTILGYGVWNEPVIEYVNSSPQESIEKYEMILQRTIDGIRKYDKKHIIFIQEPHGYYKATSADKITSGNITWGVVNNSEFKDYIPIRVTDGMRNICLEWHCYLKSAFYGNPRFGYYKKPTTEIINQAYGGQTLTAYDKTKDGEWQTVCFKPKTWDNKPINVYRPSFKVQYYPKGTKLYIRSTKYEVLDTNGNVIETETYFPDDILKSDGTSSGVIDLDEERVSVYNIDSGDSGYNDVHPMTYFTKDASSEDSKFYYDVKIVIPDGTDTSTLKENRNLVCNHKEYYVSEVDGILNRYSNETYYNEYNDKLSKIKQCDYQGILLGETGFASSNESVKTVNVLQQLQDIKEFISDNHVAFCYFILGSGGKSDFENYSDISNSIVLSWFMDSTEYSLTKNYKIGDIEILNEKISQLENKIEELQLKLESISSS